MNKLKEIICRKYLLDILKVEKNTESTQGNVYNIYTKNNKYILKIYDDISHVEAMTQLYNDLSKQFNIPSVIMSKDNESYISFDFKYLVLYSFLEGIQISELELNRGLIIKIALEVRKLHDLNQNNNYNLKKVPFGDYNLNRKSILHFDLTKHNIFYNKNKIGFIDFDDAKYGSSVCDVAILIALLFFSKKRGIDIDNLNVFIDTYYKEEQLKNEELKYIKDIAINWINHVLDGNDFDTSLRESFEIKKKLIEDNFK